MGDQKILVTQPTLPPLEDFIPLLEDIWDRKWLTNNGHYHQELEEALADYLGVPYVSLFSNGTLALITALQALRIQGEVITTPYSFVATTHSLCWNGIQPVFCDIDPNTLNLDPEKIEAAITPHTSAIMPVHVYGNPCDVEHIENIANNYGLKVIYDAAHAFGVKYKGQSVLNFGDLSILSFHATKVFNTIEGGAIISPDKKTKDRIDKLKNFGFSGETTVVAPGINAKMNELQSAFGLLQLRDIDNNIEKRKTVVNHYREQLKDISGVSFMEDMSEIDHNYAYFPIFIDQDVYGMDRDALYQRLQEHNIYGRRYFYPLISSFSMYRHLKSANPDNLPVSNEIAEKVICLPLYPELGLDIVKGISTIIKKNK